MVLKLNLGFGLGIVGGGGEGVALAMLFEESTAFLGAVVAVSLLEGMLFWGRVCASTLLGAASFPRVRVVSFLGGGGDGSLCWALTANPLPDRAMPTKRNLDPPRLIHPIPLPVRVQYLNMYYL